MSKPSRKFDRFDRNRAEYGLVKLLAGPPDQTAKPRNVSLVAMLARHSVKISLWSSSYFLLCHQPCSPVWDNEWKSHVQAMSRIQLGIGLFRVGFSAIFFHRAHDHADSVTDKPLQTILIIAVTWSLPAGFFFFPVAHYLVQGSDPSRAERTRGRASRITGVVAPLGAPSHFDDCLSARAIG